MLDTRLRVQHPTKSGKAVVLIGERGSGADPRNNVSPAYPKRFQVWALVGHELLTETRNFDSESAARAYANTVWARR